MSASMALINLTVGLILIPAGGLIVAFRKALFRSTVRTQRMIGRRQARTVERLSAPRWIGAVGIGAMLMGTLMTIAAAVALFR